MNCNEIWDLYYTTVETTDLGPIYSIYLNEGTNRIFDYGLIRMECMTKKNGCYSYAPKIVVSHECDIFEDIFEIFHNNRLTEAPPYTKETIRSWMNDHIYNDKNNNATHSNDLTVCCFTYELMNIVLSLFYDFCRLRDVFEEQYGCGMTVNWCFCKCRKFLQRFANSAHFVKINKLTKRQNKLMENAIYVRSIKTPDSFEGLC